MIIPKCWGVLNILEVKFWIQVFCGRKKLQDLRVIAKAMGIKSITTYRKDELIDLIMENAITEENEEKILTKKIEEKEEVPKEII